MKIPIITSFLLFFNISLLFASDSATVKLRYTDNKASSVSIAGSFNSWNPAGYDFIKQNGVWEIQFKVIPGYYYYKLVVDNNWIPDPLNKIKVNDGGDSFNSILKAGNPPVPKRLSRGAKFPEDKLPRPVLKDNPEFIDLYYAAWEMAWQKIMQGKPGSGMEPLFMDEGFNEMIYQWDTCFMTIFGMYGLDLFPVMASLDNFYNKQRKDGYIQRVYNQETGMLAQEPTKDEPMVNPPLFAFVELKYFQLTGDASRLKRVLPHLIDYYMWIENNCRDKYGMLYYNTPLGSGMDNTPRFNMDKGSWIDFSSQQTLAAKCIYEIAHLISDSSTANKFSKFYNLNIQKIKSVCWNESKQFFFDRTASDTLCNTVHLGAYWTLISGIADSSQAASLVNYLNDTLYFKRPNMIPTLSYSDKYYDPNGHYWRGSVWAPTNYITIKGLEQYGYYNIADNIAMNHLTEMSNVYKHFNPDENKIAYEERYSDGYKTIWECYSSEFNSPATRWDNTFYSRQDFVGWSGLGPIALLIENILGININGAENKIVWRLHRNDEHGIENISLGKNKVSLLFTPGSKKFVKIETAEPFTLELYYNNKTHTFNIDKGSSSIQLVDI